MIIRQLYRVTGIANAITYDTGLKSTEAEKKRLLSVSILTSAYADNDVQGYLERAKIFDIPDRLIDMEVDAYTTDLAKPGARISEIEMGVDIPVGETFKVAVKCGATPTDLHGCYNYELIK